MGFRGECFYSGPMEQSRITHNGESKPGAWNITSGSAPAPKSVENIWQIGFINPFAIVHAMKPYIDIVDSIRAREMTKMDFMDWVRRILTTLIICHKEFELTR